MTDGQWLFTVFVVLYFIECLNWIPLESWICAEKNKARWQFRRPSGNLGVRGFGVVLLSPVPPFRAHLSLIPWPFIPEREHLLVREEGRAQTRIEWANLSPRSEGSCVILAGSTMTRMVTETQAKEWCKQLREWADMQEDMREVSFLNYAALSLDAEALRKSAAALSERVRVLNTNAALILIWCFGVVTGIYSWYGETLLLWTALIVLLGLQVLQAMIFWRATQKPGPGSQVSYRFWKALSIALMPHLSVRAADHLCRAVPATAHPLAAILLVDPTEFLATARRFWRAARFQRGWTKTDSLPLDALALDRHFRSCGIEIAALEVPPVRDHTSRSFCPRCLAQFELAAGECRDCEGTELCAFD